MTENANLDHVGGLRLRHLPQAAVSHWQTSGFFFAKNLYDPDLTPQIGGVENLGVGGFAEA